MYGSLAGDGSIVLNGASTTPYFMVSHGEDQRDYLLFKRSVLHNLCDSLITSKTNNRGFSEGLGKELFSFRTRSDSRLRFLLDDCTENNKRRMTETWLRNMDDPALAVWYCDDGSTSNCTARLCVAGMSSSEAGLVVDWMVSRGWPARLYTRPCDGAKYIIVSGLKAGADKFWCTIAPYVPNSMSHKIPARFSGIQGSSLSYWYKSFAEKSFLDEVVEAGPLFVDSKESRYSGYSKASHPKRLREYCLVVGGHHNFFAGGLCVSNCKIDMNVLRQHLDIKVRGFLWDTMVLHHLLWEHRPHGLEELSDLELHTGDYSFPIREIVGHGRHKKMFDLIPNDLFWRYGATDAENTYRLACYYSNAVKLKENLWGVYIEESEPGMYALAEAEWNGYSSRCNCHGVTYRGAQQDQGGNDC